MHTLFDREKKILQEAESVVTDPENQESPLFSDYSILLSAYRKLFHDFQRVLKMADRQQYFIKSSEESLIEEVRTRKKIEEDLRNNESKLLEAKKTAEKALEAKAQFLATMSHEIRTPLNGIIGSANLLRMTDSSSKENDYVDMIINSGNLLLVIINDILDFSKIESGNLELEKRALDLEQCIENTLDIVVNDVARKKIDLIYQRNELILPVIIGDYVRLSQILVNLLNNAIKFTEKGAILLSVQVLEKRDNKIKLQFSVKDTGIGIQKDRLNSIFSAFSQVDPSITRKYGGTGLGLSICKKLIELFDQGKIWLDSVFGEGSTFYISFWATLANNEQYPRSIDLSEQSLKGKKGLIVNENKDALINLQQICTGLGTNVIGLDQQEAVQKVKQNENYDFLVVDAAPQNQFSEDRFNFWNHYVSQRNIPAIFLFYGGQEFDKPGDNVLYLKKTVKIESLRKGLLHFFERKKELTQITATESKKVSSSKILLVEDDEINQKIAIATFELLGYRVDLAKNGREAVMAVLSKSYDIVFMDIQMPEMDGFEATRIIREQLGAIPVIIAMTANSTREDQDICLEKGMNDFIGKPIVVEKLKKTIEKWERENEEREIALQETSDNPEVEEEKSLIDANTAETIKVNYNEQFIEKLIDYYINDLSESIQELKEMLVDENYQQLKYLCHRLKGSSMNLGASEIAKVLRSLEDLSEKEDEKQLAQLLDGFEKIALETIKELKNCYLS